VSGKRPHRKKPQFQNQRASAPPSHTGVGVRKVSDPDVWELVHPRCALERAEDVEEVRKMIAAGETDVAVDELRWLLDGCSDFIEAHRVLGELAMLEEDVPLARGHFGYAYQLGVKAIDQARPTGTFPYALDNNKAFLEAGKGLVWSLQQLGKRDTALEVIERLLQHDPSDPLGLAALREPDASSDSAENARNV